MADKWSGEDRRRKRKLDLDVRGILAILSITYIFILGVTQLVLGFIKGVTVTNIKDLADVPAWAATIAAAIIGYYFGSRGTNGQH